MIIESGASYGAYNDDNDPDGTKRFAHAVSYYEELRNRNKNTIISTLSNNTGIDIETVTKMYEHVFVDKHYLETGFTYFDPDYDMAESFRRLREDKQFFEHDIIMINMKH